MKSKMKTIGWLMLRLAAAASVTAAVFFVLVARDPVHVEPKDADADIADFMSQAVFAPKNTTKLIESSGLAPRAYEVNGNTVYFAVGQTGKSPREVLDYYQSEMVAAGINSRKWTHIPQERVRTDPKNADKHREDAHEMISAMMDGEVIPYVVSEKYTAMGGPIIKADSYQELFEEWGHEELLRDHNKVMKGWRFIDAQKSSNGLTRVTSVWADEDFDVNQFKNPNSANLGPNEFVPSCPGCKLVARSKSLQKDEPISFEMLKSTQDPATVASFYSKAMFARGWDLAESNHIQQFAASQVPDHPFNTRGPMLTFSKDDRNVTYTILPDEDGNTIVTAVEEW